MDNIGKTVIVQDMHTRKKLMLEKVNAAPNMRRVISTGILIPELH